MGNYDPERCEMSDRTQQGVQCPNRWTHEATYGVLSGPGAVRICTEHAQNHPDPAKFRRVR